MKLRTCDRTFCFANDDMLCRILKDTEWGGKPCPFFAHRDNVSVAKLEADCKAYEYAATKGTGKEDKTDSV